MSTTYMSKLTLPVNVEGTITNVEFTIKDQEARDLILGLGKALYWAGVTETALTDGATTNPIVIATYAAVEPEEGDDPSEKGWYEADATSATGYKLSEDESVVEGKTYYVRTAENVTVHDGAIVSYQELEFVFNGTKWQAFGHANLGALAFKNNASASYTPAGSVTLTEDTAATSDTVVGVASNGTTPYFTVSGETATFHPGAMPTLAAEKTFLTGEQVLSASFSGTAATITVE